MLISREQFMALTTRINERYLPWLNVVQGDLTLSRLARLSLFQVSVGICFVLLNGTLNRIMVVELGRAAWLVSAMLALPLLLAPARVLLVIAQIHISLLRLPTTPVFMDGNHGAVRWTRIDAVCTHPYDIRRRQCLVDGLCHVTGCFIAGGCGYAYDTDRWPCFSTDLASENTRHQVVTMLYLMLLVGMVIGALGFSLLLELSAISGSFR